MEKGPSAEFREGGPIGLAPEFGEEILHAVNNGNSEVGLRTRLV